MKILSILILVILSGLGVWYMANPELWNNREYVKDTIEEAKDFFEEAVVLTSMYSCTSPTREISESNTLNHYTWTDEDGGVHFSSEDPGFENVEIFDLNRRGELKYFNLNIEFIGGSSVLYLENRLSAQLNSMYKILSELLDKDKIREVDLNLLIYPDRNSYLRYAEKSGGENMAASNGFYSFAKNEAVTYQFKNDEKTFEVARHESLHVMLRGMLGETPNWLNEGLGEYFEGMAMISQYQRVDLNNEWFEIALNSIYNGYPENLSDYLLLQEVDWRGNNNNENIHYALGWSLVYFLLSTPEGRNSLSLIMNRSAEYPCDFLDTPKLFEQSYPNGFDQLQADFVNWLKGSEEFSPHRY